MSLKRWGIFRRVQSWLCIADDFLKEVFAMHELVIEQVILSMGNPREMRKKSSAIHCDAIPRLHARHNTGKSHANVCTSSGLIYKIIIRKHIY